MSSKHREEFLKSEAQALRLLEEAGFTEPDFVLPHWDTRHLVLEWTEPDTVEVIVARSDLAEGVLPEAVARAVAGAGGDMREVLRTQDVPPPDIIRPGRNLGEAEFIWREERLLVIVGEDGKMALPN